MTNEQYLAAVKREDDKIEELRRRVAEKMGMSLDPYSAFRIENFEPKTANGDKMTTSLFEYVCVDCRESDDDLATGQGYVRATSYEDAKLRVALRRGFAEGDIKYIDFWINELRNVQPVAEADKDED